MPCRHCGANTAASLDGDNTSVNASADSSIAIPRNPAWVFNRNELDWDGTLVANARERTINEVEDPLLQQRMKLKEHEVESWVDELRPRQKQALGVALSIFGGFCYGTFSEKHPSLLFLREEGAYLYVLLPIPLPEHMSVRSAFFIH